ncbi:MAG TPA: lytic transglycosylase domain-containing protein [Candidatus Saccharimonadia bacterium]|nr:lytic transglycosylase domain-containing protein [Candidatus Saccharimonadia bacterium]
MTFGLKTTIIASTALAGALNLMQFAVSYNQHAKAAFVPNWAEAAASPTPKPAVAASTVAATPAPATAAAPAPAADPAVTATAKLASAGLRTEFAADYLSVQAKTGTPWPILAAVHSVETGQSGNTNRRSSAGATGPMQFMPATFAHYALDGDGNGAKDITGLSDSLLTAGRYLAAGGADKGRYSAALYNYNHSNAYVSKVLGIAHRLGI